MSVFSRILKQALDTIPDARGAVFSDWEGEAVDAYSGVMGNTNLRIMGAHWGVIYYQARAAFEKLDLGMVGQVVLQFTKRLVVIQRVTDEYFVVITLGDQGHLGRTLRMVDHLAVRLREEM